MWAQVMLTPPAAQQVDRRVHRESTVRFIHRLKLATGSRR
jgi:hypothetical protein